MHPIKRLWRRLAPLVLLSSLLVAVAPAQRVVAWGDNGVGQLNIPGGVQSNITAVSAGYYMTCFLTLSGGVLACGDNSYGELNVPVAAQSGVSKIAAGVLHVLAIKDGGVIAWGSNERGETNVPAAALSGVTAVAGGEYFSLALKDGGVIGWGSNDYGVLTIPVEAQSGVTDISTGSYHSLALKNGGVLGWGYNIAGSLDIPAAAQSDVVAISAGYLHSLALKSDGSVVAWGWNNMGQCNVPDGAKSGVIAVDAGYDFSIALKQDGSVLMWGDNDYGWLNIPAEGQPAVAISASAYHTVSITPAAFATLDQTEVFSGDAATGTVHLAFAAGPGGQQVDLVSNNPVVHVPAYAIVPEGATTVTFPVTTDTTLGVDLNTTIRTSYLGTATIPATLKVKGTPVSVTFNRPTVVGGSTQGLTATLTLGATQTTDSVIGVSSSDPTTLPVPASITIPAGQTTATLTLQPKPVTGAGTTVVISTTANGNPLGSAPIDVRPFQAKVSLESVSITSGESTYAFVTLNAATKNAVTVTTGGSDAQVTMPSSIRINPGATTGFFPIATNPSKTSYTYHVTVAVAGNSYATSLRVLSVPVVSVLSMSSGLYGNTKVLGTVKLNKPAGLDGVVVDLTSHDGITVPASVTIPCGQTYATFDVTVPDVPSVIDTQITATTQGFDYSKTFKVMPIKPTLLTLSASSVTSGTSFTGTVTLNVAPTVDTQVQLESNNPVVTVPATVTILAGHNTATFTATSTHVVPGKTVKITVTKNGVTMYRTIKVLA